MYSYSWRRTCIALRALHVRLRVARDRYRRWRCAYYISPRPSTLPSTFLNWFSSLIPEAYDGPHPQGVDILEVYPDCEG